jgi:hypothetical protein
MKHRLLQLDLLELLIGHLHAVWDGFPPVVVDEIIDANLFWLALWTPVLASILEVALPLILFRIT